MFITGITNIPGITEIPPMTWINYTSGWIPTKESPLLKEIPMTPAEIDFKGLEEGATWLEKNVDSNFMAAVPTNNGWWIQHCCIDDDGDLMLIVGDDMESAGWEVSDVMFYWPVPAPPFELKIVDGVDGH